MHNSFSEMEMMTMNDFFSHSISTLHKTQIIQVFLIKRNVLYLPYNARAMINLKD